MLSPKLENEISPEASPFAACWSACRRRVRLSIFLPFPVHWNASFCRVRLEVHGNFRFPFSHRAWRNKLLLCAEEFNRFPYGSRLILRSFYWFYDGHRPNGFGFVIRAVNGIREAGIGRTFAWKALWGRESFLERRKFLWADKKTFIPFSQKALTDKNFYLFSNFIRLRTLKLNFFHRTKKILFLSTDW